MYTVRGYRNNNPGNIKWDGATQWKGMTGQDGPFIRFDSMAHGYRALGRVLRSYERQGINTVRRVIDRWAPPSENNTTSYINHVSSKLGVHPDAGISISQHIVALAQAIARHENGFQAHTDDQVRVWVNMA